MDIIVNNEPRAVRDGCTVDELIEQLGLALAICAAEVNRAVVPKAARAGHVLRAGDRVEIVTLVGGG